MFVQKNLILLICLVCARPLMSMTMSKKVKNPPLLVVRASKNTEKMWDAAEQGDGKTLIDSFITHGGSLRLTNEYGENAIKVLIKQNNNHN